MRYFRKMVEATAQRIDSSAYALFGGWRNNDIDPAGARKAAPTVLGFDNGSYHLR